jgi:hypothetical protein
MKGKFYQIQFRDRLLTCSIALILVGGFGTRLRPLVCSHSPLCLESTPSGLQRLCNAVNY